MAHPFRSGSSRSGAGHGRAGHEPALITEAPVNADDELASRRKRYLIMMSIRAVCIVGAATTIQFSGWLAAVFVAAALVLPWIAVLIANDRPPKRELRFRRFVGAGDRPPNNQLTDGSERSGDQPPPEPPRPTVIDI